MRRLISIGMLLVLIVLFTILAGAGKGKFLSFDNLIEIVRDASIPAIVGVGVTFVIITAGITREKLYPGEAEFLGRGVSYCATCDGMLYRGKTVAVVGGGEEARQDADFLEGIGCQVLRFEKNGKYEISGGMKADTLTFAGESHKVDCVFIIKDTVSVTQLVPGLTYENGGIVVDRHMATAVPGVFAAGDCTGKPLQLAKAVGEGNVAALSACDWLDRK